MLPNYIIKVLEKIANDLNFIDYKFETDRASSHGDNFLGVLIGVTINGMQKINGQLVAAQLNLICKTPPANENRRKNFQSSTVFDREIHAYAEILPSLVKFQREKGLKEDDSFLAFPKVYACDVDAEHGAYILVMEDLKAKNYKMWPKEKTIPIDHELLLMKELGKLHGISFAFKDQRPNEFNAYKQLTDPFSEIVRGSMSSFFNQQVQMVRDIVDDPAHKKIVDHFEIDRMLDNCFGWESRDKFGVISHGDCWNNNIMYKYTGDNGNVLESVCLLDWQLLRYCSPALDLLYNIFSSTDKAFRELYFEKLLETYYSSLCGMIRQLGSDPNILFTYQDLKNELRKFGDFALWSGPMILRVSVADGKDLVDLDEYSDAIDRCEPIDLFRQFDDEKHATYCKLVKDVVHDLYEFGYVR